MERKTNKQRIEELEAKLLDLVHQNTNNQDRKYWTFDKITKILEILFIGVVGLYLACISNLLVKESNKISKDGTERSLTLMDKANNIMSNSETLMSNSNIIAEFSLGIQRNSNSLIENSNNLMELGNRLEESSRKAGMLSITDNLILRVVSELKYNEYTKSNSISENLIESISAHSNLISPYYNLDEGGTRHLYISPGRGLLLRNVLKSNLSKSNLIDIFNQSNFEYCYFPKVRLDSVYIYNAKLANSYFSESVISKSTFSNTDFNSTTFLGTKFEFDTIKTSTTFNQCKMENVSFWKCVIKDNVQFIDCPFINVNFKGAELENLGSYCLIGPFISCNLSSTSFENICLDGVKFQNCRWDETTFKNCNLSRSYIDLNQKDNYNMFEKTNLQGLRGGSHDISNDFKIRLINSILSKNSLLIKNEHFLKYHTIKDTLVGKQKVIVANFKKQ